MVILSGIQHFKGDDYIRMETIRSGFPKIRPGLETKTITPHPQALARRKRAPHPPI